MKNIILSGKIINVDLSPNGDKNIYGRPTVELLNGKKIRPIYGLSYLTIGDLVEIKSSSDGMDFICFPI